MDNPRYLTLALVSSLFILAAGFAPAEVTIDNSDPEPAVTWGPAQVYKDWYPGGWFPTWRISTNYHAKNPYPNTLPSPLPHASWANFAQDIPLYSPDSTSTSFFAWGWAGQDSSSATLQDPSPWFRWTPTLPSAGWYEVSACWPSSQEYTMEAKYIVNWTDPDFKKLIYSRLSFYEAASDNGLIDNTTPLVIMVNGDSFTGSDEEDFVSTGKVIVSNLPAGLSAVATRKSSTTVEVILSGNATTHTIMDNVLDVTIEFQNTAFTGGIAADIADSTRSDIRIDYNRLLTWIRLDEASGLVAADTGKLKKNGDLTGDQNWLPSGGKFDGTFSFNGTNNYFSLGQPPELSFTPTLDSFTIVCWFKTTSAISGSLVSKCNNGTSYVQYYLYKINNQLGARCGADNSILITQTVNNDVWRMATLVNDGSAGTFTLYLDDGTYSATGTSGSQGDYARDVLIGARRDGSNTSSNTRFDGQIDDVRIYGQALSLAEIQYLYASTEHSAPPSEEESGIALQSVVYIDQLHLGGGGTGNYDFFPLSDAYPLTFTHQSLGSVTYPGRFYSGSEGYGAPSPSTMDDEYNYQAISTYPTTSSSHTGNHYPIFQRNHEPEFISLGIYYFNMSGGYLTITESETANTTPGNRITDARFGQTAQFSNSMAADAARFRRVDSPIDGAGPVLIDKNDVLSSNAVVLPNYGPRAEYNINLNEYVRGPAGGKYPGAYPYTHWYAGRYRIPVADHYRNVSNRTRIHLFPGDLDRISWVQPGDLVEYCFAEYAKSDGIYTFDERNPADDTIFLSTMIPYECTYWVHNPYGNWRGENSNEFIIFNRKLPPGGLDRITVTDANSGFDLLKVTDAFPYLNGNTTLYEGDMFPQYGSGTNSLRMRLNRTSSAATFGKAVRTDVYFSVGNQSYEPTDSFVGTTWWDVQNNIFPIGTSYKDYYFTWDQRSSLLVPDNIAGASPYLNYMVREPYDLDQANNAFTNSTLMPVKASPDIDLSVFNIIVTDSTISPGQRLKSAYVTIKNESPDYEFSGGVRIQLVISNDTNINTLDPVFFTRYEDCKDSPIGPLSTKTFSFNEDKLLKSLIPDNTTPGTRYIGARVYSTIDNIGMNDFGSASAYESINVRSVDEADLRLDRIDVTDTSIPRYGFFNGCRIKVTNVSDTETFNRNAWLSIYLSPDKEITGTGNDINVGCDYELQTRGTATTNAGGNFAFTSVATGSYIVTPSLQGYSFNPPTRNVSITDSTPLTALAFTATENPYLISGTVSTAIRSGVTITLTGAATATTTTDNAGFYSFPRLASGVYTVTPSLSGFTFSPATRAITITTANSTGQNFTPTALAYYVSGAVNAPSIMQGVTIRLSGAGSATRISDTSGNYAFGGLTNGESYTITPTLSGYTFTPASYNITISSANITGRNFTWTLSPNTLSGSVSGAVQSGVTITLSGNSSATTTTDGSGNYSFPVTDGSYTVTASLGTYMFSPASINVNIAGASVSGQNFTASVHPYAISGSVSGAITSGITVTLSGAATATTLTNAIGDYSFTVANGSYTVTPTLAGFTFSPASRNVTVSGGNITGQTFISTANTYTISGSVSGAAQSGISMKLSSPTPIPVQVFFDKAPLEPGLTGWYSVEIDHLLQRTVANVLPGSYYVGAYLDHTWEPDGAKADNWTISSIGLELNPETGVITGSSSEAGYHELYLSCADANGKRSASRRFLLPVIRKDIAILDISVDETTVAANTPFNVELTIRNMGSLPITEEFCVAIWPVWRSTATPSVQSAPSASNPQFPLLVTGGLAVGQERVITIPNVLYTASQYGYFKLYGIVNGKAPSLRDSSNNYFTEPRVIEDAYENNVSEPVYMTVNTPPTITLDGLDTVGGAWPTLTAEWPANMDIDGLRIEVEDVNVNDVLNMTITHNSSLSTLGNILSITPNPSQTVVPDLITVDFSGNTGPTAGTIIYDITVQDGIYTLTGQLTITVRPPNQTPILTPMANVQGAFPNYFIVVDPYDLLPVDVGFTGSDANNGDILTMNLTFNSALSDFTAFTASMFFEFDNQGTFDYNGRDIKTAPAVCTAEFVNSGGVPDAGNMVWNVSLTDRFETLNARLTVMINEAPAFGKLANVSGGGALHIATVVPNNPLSLVGLTGTDINRGQTLTISCTYDSAASSYASDPFTFNSMDSAVSPNEPLISFSGTAPTALGIAVYTLVLSDMTATTETTLRIIVGNPPAVTPSNITLDGDHYSLTLNEGQSVPASVGFIMSEIDAGDLITATLHFYTPGSDFAVSPFGFTNGTSGSAVNPGTVSLFINGASDRPGVAKYRLIATDAAAVVEKFLYVTVNETTDDEPILHPAGFVSTGVDQFTLNWRDDATFNTSNMYYGFGVYDEELGQGGGSVTLTITEQSAPSGGAGNIVTRTPDGITTTTLTMSDTSKHLFLKFHNAPTVVGNYVFNVRVQNGSWDRTYTATIIAHAAGGELSTPSVTTSGLVTNSTARATFGPDGIRYESLAGDGIGSGVGLCQGDIDNNQQKLTAWVIDQAETTFALGYEPTSESTTTSLYSWYSTTYSQNNFLLTSTNHPGRVKYNHLLTDGIYKHVTPFTFDIYGTDACPGSDRSSIFGGPALTGDPRLYCLDIQTGSTLPSGAFVRIIDPDAGVSGGASPDTLSIESALLATSDYPASPFDFAPQAADQIAPNPLNVEFSGSCATGGLALYGITVRDSNTPKSIYTIWNEDVARVAISVNPAGNAAPTFSAASGSVTGSYPIFTATVANSLDDLPETIGLTGGDTDVADTLTISIQYNSSLSTYPSDPFGKSPYAGYESGSAPTIAISGGTPEAAGTAAYDVFLTDGHTRRVALLIVVVNQTTNRPPLLESIGAATGSNGVWRYDTQTTSTIAFTTGIGLKAIDSDIGDALSLTFTFNSALSTYATSPYTTTPSSGTYISDATVESQTRLIGNAPVGGLAVYDVDAYDGVDHTRGTISLVVRQSALGNVPAFDTVGFGSVGGMQPCFTATLPGNTAVSSVGLRATDIDTTNTLSFIVTYNATLSSIPATGVTVTPPTPAVSPLSLAFSGATPNVTQNELMVWDIVVQDGTGHARHAQLRITVQPAPPNNPPVLTRQYQVTGTAPNYSFTMQTGQTIDAASGVGFRGTDIDGGSKTLTMAYQSGPGAGAFSFDPVSGTHTTTSEAIVSVVGTPMLAGDYVFTVQLTDGVDTITGITLTIHVDSVPPPPNNPPYLTAQNVTGGPAYSASLMAGGTLADVRIFGNDPNAGDSITLTVSFNAGMSTGYAVSPFTLTDASVPTTDGIHTAVSPAVATVQFSGVAPEGSGAAPWQAVYTIHLTDGEIVQTGTLTINVYEVPNTSPQLTASAGISGTPPNQYIILTAGNTLSNVGYTLSDADSGDSLTLTVAFNAGESIGFATDPFTVSNGGNVTVTAPATASITVSGTSTYGTGAGPWYVVYNVTGTDGEAVRNYRLTLQINEPLNSTPAVTLSSGISGAFSNMTLTLDLNDGLAVSDAIVTLTDADAFDPLSLTFQYNVDASTYKVVGGPAWTWTPGLMATGTSPISVQLSAVTNLLGTFVYNVTATDGKVTRFGILTVYVIHSGNAAPTVTVTGAAGAFPEFSVSAPVGKTFNPGDLTIIGSDADATDTVTVTVVFDPALSLNYSSNPLSYDDDSGTPDDGIDTATGTNADVGLVGTLPGSPTGYLSYTILISDGLYSRSARLFVQITNANVSPIIMASPTLTDIGSGNWTLTISEGQTISSAWISGADPNTNQTLTLTVSLNAGLSDYVTSPFNLLPDDGGVGRSIATYPSVPVVNLNGAASAGSGGAPWTATYNISLYDGQTTVNGQLTVTITATVPNTPPALTPDAGVGGLSPNRTVSVYKGATLSEVGFFGNDIDSGQTLQMTMTFNAGGSSFASSPFSYYPWNAQSTATAPNAARVNLTGSTTLAGTAAYNVSLTDGTAVVAETLLVTVLNRIPELSVGSGVSGAYPNYVAFVDSGVALSNVFIAGSDSDPNDPLTLTLSFNAGASVGFASNPFVFSPASGIHNVTTPETARVSLTGSASGGGTAVYNIQLSDGSESVPATLSLVFSNQPPTLRCDQMSRVGNAFTLSADDGVPVSVTINGLDGDAGDALTLSLAWNSNGTLPSSDLTLSGGGTGTSTAPTSAQVTISGTTAAASGSYQYNIVLSDGVNTNVVGSVTINVTAGPVPPNNAPDIYIPNTHGTPPLYYQYANQDQALSPISITGYDPDAENVTLTVVFTPGGGFVANPFSLSDGGSPAAALYPVVSITGTATIAGTVTYAVTVNDGEDITTATLEIRVLPPANLPPVLQKTAGVSGFGTVFTLTVNEGDTLSAAGLIGSDSNADDSLTLTLTFNAGLSDYTVSPFAFDPVGGSATATSPSQAQVLLTGAATAGSGAGPWTARYDATVNDSTETTTGTLTITINPVINTEPTLSALSGLTHVTGTQYRAIRSCGSALDSIGFVGFDSSAGDTLTLSINYSGGDYGADPYGRSPSSPTTVSTPGTATMNLTGSTATGIGAGPWTASYSVSLSDGVNPAKTATIEIIAINDSPTISKSGDIIGSGSSFFLYVTAGDTIDDAILYGSDPNTGDALTLTVNYLTGSSTYAVNPLSYLGSPTVSSQTADSITVQSVAPTAASVAFNGQISLQGVAVYTVTLTDGVNIQKNATLTVIVNPPSVAPTLTPTANVRAVSGGFETTVAAGIAINNAGLMLSDPDSGEPLTLSFAFNAAASTYAASPFTFSPVSGASAGTAPSVLSVSLAGSAPAAGLAVYDVQYSDGTHSSTTTLAVNVVSNIAPVLTAYNLSGVAPNYTLSVAPSATIPQFELRGTDSDNGNPLTMTVNYSSVQFPVEPLVRSQKLTTTAPDWTYTRISGTAPGSAGTMQYAVTLSDGVNPVVNATVTITVAAVPANNAPYLTATGATGASPHFALSAWTNTPLTAVSVQAADNDAGDPLTLTVTYSAALSTIPDGYLSVSLNPGGGQSVAPDSVTATWTGSVMVAGTLVYNLSVFDGQATTNGTLTITVSTLQTPPVLTADHLTATGPNEWSLTVGANESFSPAPVIRLSDANVNDLITLTIVYDDVNSTLATPPFAFAPSTASTYAPSSLSAAMSGWTGVEAGTAIFRITATDGTSILIGKVTITVLQANTPPVLTASGLSGSAQTGYYLYVQSGGTVSSASVNGSDADASDSLTLELTYNAALSTAPNALALLNNPANGAGSVSVSLAGSVGTTVGSMVYDATLSDGVHTVVTTRVTIAVTAAPANNPPALSSAAINGAPVFYKRIDAGGSMPSATITASDSDGDTVTLSLSYSALQSTLPSSLVTLTGNPASGVSTASVGVSSASVGSAPGIIVYTVSANDGESTTAGSLTIEIVNSAPTILPGGSVGGATPSFTVNVESGEALSGVSINGTDINAGDSLTLTLSFNSGASLNFATNPFTLSNGGTTNATAPATAMVSVTGSTTTTGFAAYDITLTDGTQTRTAMLFVIIGEANVPPQLSASDRIGGSAPNYTMNVSTGAALSNVWFAGADMNSGDVMTLSLVFRPSLSSYATTPFTINGSPSTATSPSAAVVSLTGSASAPGTAVYDLTLDDGKNPAVTARLVVTVSLNGSPTYSGLGLQQAGTAFSLSLPAGQSLNGIYIRGNDNDSGDALTLSMAYDAGGSTLPDRLSAVPSPATATAPASASAAITGNVGSSAGVLQYSLTLSDGVNPNVLGSLTVTIMEANVAPVLTAAGVGGSAPSFGVNVVAGQNLSGVSIVGTDSNATDSLTLTLAYDSQNSTLPNIFTAAPNPATGSGMVSAAIGGNAGTTLGVVAFRITLTDGWTTKTGSLVIAVTDAPVNTPPLLEAVGIAGDAPSLELRLSKNEAASGCFLRGRDANSGDSLLLSVSYDAGNSTLSDILALDGTSAAATAPSNAVIELTGDAGQTAGIAVYDVTLSDGTTVVSSNLTVIVENQTPFLSAGAGLTGSSPFFQATVPAEASLSGISLTLSDDDSGDALQISLAFDAGESIGYASSPFVASPGLAANAVTPSAAMISLTGSAPSAGLVIYRIVFSDGDSTQFGRLALIISDANRAPVFLSGAAISGSAPSFTVSTATGLSLNDVWIGGADVNNGDVVQLAVMFNAAASTGFASSPFTLAPSNGLKTASAPSVAWVQLTGAAAATGTAVYDMTLTDGVHGIQTATLTIAVTGNTPPVLSSDSFGGASPAFTASVNGGGTVAGIIVGSDSNAGDSLTLTASWSAASTLPDCLTLSPNPSNAVSPSIASIAFVGTAPNATGVLVYNLVLSDGVNPPVNGTVTFTVTKVNLAPQINVTGMSGNAASGYTLNIASGTSVSGVYVRGSDFNAGDNLTLTVTHSSGQTLIVTGSPATAAAPDVATVALSSNPLSVGAIVYNVSLSDGTATSLTTLTINVQASADNNPSALYGSASLGAGPAFALDLSCGESVSGLTLSGFDPDSGNALTLTVTHSSGPAFLSFIPNPATATATNVVQTMISGTAPMTTGASIYNILLTDGAGGSIAGSLTLTVSNAAPTIIPPSGLGGVAPNYTLSVLPGESLANVTFTGADTDNGSALTMTLTFDPALSVGFASSPFSISPLGGDSAIAPDTVSATLSGAASSGGVARYAMTVSDGAATTTASLTVTVDEANVSPALQALNATRIGATNDFDVYATQNSIIGGIAILGSDANVNDTLTLTLTYSSGTGASSLSLLSNPDSATTPESARVDVQGNVGGVIGDIVYAILLTDGTVSVNGTLTIHVVAPNQAPTLSAGAGVTQVVNDFSVTVTSGAAITPIEIRASDVDAGDTMSLQLVYNAALSTRANTLTATPAVASAIAPAIATTTLTGTAPSGGGTIVFDIRASDGGRLTVGTLTITLAVAQSSPTLSGENVVQTLNAFTRNLAFGTTLSSVAIRASDVDVGDTITLTLTYNAGSSTLSNIFAFSPPSGIDSTTSPSSARVSLTGNSGMTAGTLVYNIVASDGVRTTTGTLTFVIDAAAANNAPILTPLAGVSGTSPNFTASVDTFASLANVGFLASDPDSGDTVTLTMARTSGLTAFSLNPVTGISSGYGNQQVNATGSSSAAGTAVYSINVTDGTPAADINAVLTITVSSTAVFYPVSFQVNISGVLTDPSQLTATLYHSSGTPVSSVPTATPDALGAFAMNVSLGSYYIRFTATGYALTPSLSSVFTVSGAMTGPTTTIVSTVGNTPLTLGGTGITGGPTSFALSVKQKANLSGVAITASDVNAGDLISLTLAFNPSLSTTGMASGLLTLTPGPTTTATAPSVATITLTGNAGTTVGRIVYDITANDGTDTVLGTLTITVVKVKKPAPGGCVVENRPANNGLFVAVGIVIGIAAISIRRRRNVQR